MGAEDAVADGGEEGGDEEEGDDDAVAFFLEEAGLGEFGGEVSVVLGDVGDVEVLEVVAGEEAVEVGPGGGGVEGDEGVGDVVAGEVEEGDGAARVVFSPICDVVDFALDRQPEIVGLVVLLQLVGGDELVILSAIVRHC